MTAICKIKRTILFLLSGLMLGMSMLGMNHIFLGGSGDYPAGAMMAGVMDSVIETKNNGKRIDVPFIDQRIQYPTGCESVSAVMVLQKYGIPITVDEFIDGYLPQGNTPYLVSDGCYQGSDPRECFLGSPYSQNGWGCYAGVIAKAMRNVIAGEDYIVLEPDNKTMKSLCREYIDEGTPVIVWATIDMSEPQEGMTWNITGTDRYFTWIAPLHALVLVGYDDDYYYFNDPLQGKYTAYDKGVVEENYDYIGRQSVVMLTKDRV